MRIAYVLSQYPARSETFIAREMQELHSQGWEVTIARLRWSDTDAGIEVPGAEVLPLKWNPLEWLLGVQWAARKAPRALVQIGRDLVLATRPSATWARLLILSLIVLALARTLDTKSIDHLRAHFLDTEAIGAYWLSLLLGIPYSLTLHTPNTRFSPNLLHRVVDEAVFLAMENRDVKTKISDATGRVDGIYVIRNGVRVPQDEISPFSPSSPWSLLAVGRLVDKKGFSVLLEASKHLCSWGYLFHCTIIGDGPLRQSLAAQAHALNLADRITFRGAQSNEAVLSAMQNHDVLVTPSRPASDGDRDGIPTVLLEALARGTPVVASNFAGIPELVEDGKTGRLVPPNKPVVLAQTLRNLFRNPVQASSMAAAGRDRVSRHFNLTREIGKLTKLIERHSTNSSRPPPPASTNRPV